MSTWLEKKIHAVDKLDAHAVMSRDGTVLSLEQIMIYTNIKRFTASGVTAGQNFLNTLNLPSGKIIIVCYVTVTNNAKSALGNIWLSPGDGTLGLMPLGEGVQASGTGRYSDAMAHKSMPIILTAGTGLQIRDSNWEAGNTVTVNVLYYEIEV